MSRWPAIGGYLLRMVPLCVAGAVVQTTLMVDLRFDGVSPELVVVMAVIAGLYGGPEAGLYCGFVGGLLYDAWLTTPFGLSAIVYASGAYVVGSVQGTLHEPAWWLSAGAGGLGAATLTGAHAFAGEVIGQDLVDGRLPRIVIIVGIVGAILGALVSAPVQWAVDPLLGRHDRARRRDGGA